MIINMALILCSMILALTGLVLLCVVWSVGLAAYLKPINIFIIFPLSVYYLYVCFNGGRARVFIGLFIVLAQIFPVVLVGSSVFADGELAWNIFGTGNYLVMPEKVMPWQHLKDTRTLIFMFGFLPAGFALMELGGWCFRKAQVGSPSPRARVVMKGATLFLVNAINLTMLAALAGLVSKGDTTWGYGVYFLSVWAIGTFLLALFIWFRPTWRWWAAMLPSMAVLYVMPVVLGAHIDSLSGEIVSPWNEKDDGRAIKAPKLPDAHTNDDPNRVDPAARSEADYPVTPLMLAAGDGTPEEVKSEIAKGADIHAKNIYGTNALMYAALAGKPENIKVLLAAGASVNDQDDKGNTALSLARQQGHDEVVNLLVSAGAKE